MHTLLLTLHLLALAVGGAATFGNPVVGFAMDRNPPARPALATVGKTLTLMGRGAMTVLIVTGVLLIWTSWGSGVWGLWFVLKLLAVAGLVAFMVIVPRLARQAQAGDTGAAARLKSASPAGPALLALVVLFAVLAFG